MIKFMRKHAAKIVIIIVVFFGVTMFAGSFLLRNLYNTQEKKAGRESQEQLINAIATVGSLPINTRKYSESLNFYFNQYQSSSPGYKMVPEILELFQYNALTQAAHYSILLDTAKNNKLKVTKAEVNGSLENIYRQYNLKNRKDLKNLLKQNNYPYKVFLENLTDDILVNKFVDTLKANVQVTQKDIDNKFIKLKVNHLLIKPEEKADLSNSDLEKFALHKIKDIRQQIMDGLSFSKAVKKYSDDLFTKKVEGSLGWIQAGQMVKEFEQAAFSLDKNQISDHVKTRYGYHLIQVVDRQIIKKAADYDEAKEKQQLLTQKQDEEVNNFIEEYFRKHELQINEPSIFAYKAKLQGDFKTAINSYQSLISRNPENPLPHYMIGKTYLLNNNTSAALKEFQKAELKGQMNPALDLPSVHIEIGNIYKNENRSPEMLAQYDKALELGVDNLGVLKNLKNIFEKLSDKKRVVKTNKEILKIEAKIKELTATKNVETVSTKEEKTVESNKPVAKK